VADLAALAAPAGGVGAVDPQRAAAGLALGAAALAGALRRGTLTA
jgi:hypothetical protein